MIDAIRTSFKKALPSLDWMDEKTRLAAEDKVLVYWLSVGGWVGVEKCILHSNIIVTS